MKFTKDVEMIPIWGEVIPGNTGKSKLDVMSPDLNMTFEDIFNSKGGLWDKSTPEYTNTVPDDTLVWRDEVLEGYAKETFDDVPFIVPFLVPGSKKAVISCPGGAYLGKSVVGEGEDIASFLNEAGISCFVLWYRSCPYESPYMYLDLQRAIRYIRFHADDFGIDPNQITTIGFSAGGNLNMVTSVVYGNKPIEIEGYTPDEIDAVDANVNGLAGCYPAVSVENDKILKVLFGMDAYRDKVKANECAMSIDVCANLKEGMPPMFLCLAEDDEVVPAIHLAKVNTRAIELGIPTEFHMFPKGGHGFGGCVPHPNPFGIPDYTPVESWKELFVKWLNRTFE